MPQTARRKGMKDAWENVIPVTGQIKRFLGDR